MQYKKALSASSLTIATLSDAWAIAFNCTTCVFNIEILLASLYVCSFNNEILLASLYVCSFNNEILLALSSFCLNLIMIFSIASNSRSVNIK